MKLRRVALRSVNDGFYHLQFNRSLSSLSPANSNLGPESWGSPPGNPTESTEDFESRIFGGQFDDTPSFQKPGMDNTFYGQGLSSSGGGSNIPFFGGKDGTFSSLSDGMEGRLKKAATYFEVNPEEISSPDYSFRPDVNLNSGMTYTPEDLNIRKPGVWRPSKRGVFEVTTKEVLEKADFRNVRLLANFLTEAGIIVKRSKTGISAKAQRKIAREIKTARAFGLLPFTTMGTKAFVYGKTMEDQDNDFEPDIYISGLRQMMFRIPLLDRCSTVVLFV